MVDSGRTGNRDREQWSRGGAAQRQHEYIKGQCPEGFAWCDCTGAEDYVRRGKLA
jgi:hypothetical protein